MKLYKPLDSSVWHVLFVDVLRRERNNFNPPVAFLKPRNEGIAEFIRLLASELLKGLSFKCVSRAKCHPENRNNPPFCFAQIFAPAILGSVVTPRPYALVSGLTKKKVTIN